MEAAVKIQGRTFRLLGKDTHGYGLSYVTHEREAGLRARWQNSSMRHKKEKADLIFAEGFIG